jgi:uncharacterized protein (TIGR03643 family)
MNFQLSASELSRLIEMAWEDRTPFEAIEAQFGLNQEKVIAVMRSEMKLSSFKTWRARARGRTTKHSKLRPEAMNSGSKHLASHRVPQR